MVNSGTVTPLAYIVNIILVLFFKSFCCFVLFSWSIGLYDERLTKLLKMGCVVGHHKFLNLGKHFQQYYISWYKWIFEWVSFLFLKSTVWLSNFRMQKYIYINLPDVPGICGLRNEIFEIYMRVGTATLYASILQLSTKWFYFKYGKWGN